ncbi:MAG: peptide chain release factor 2 [Armatimonadota bacterium]
MVFVIDVRELDALEEQAKELRRHFDLEKRQSDIEKLEAEVSKPGFWDNQEEAQKVMRLLSQTREFVGPWLDLEKKLADLRIFRELAAEDGGDYEEELERELAEVKSAMEKLELSTLLSDEHDAANAILEVNSGAGGTESCDWVQMLLRMYTRWAEGKGYSVEIIDSVEGDVAGLKNVTVIIRGLNAYGFLKSERGVHRLVRISPFDSNKRRHTSFASVDVVPEMTEAEDVEVNSDDLRIDTFRASSAGGQHVNKTDSAVRITHIPTGIVVSCQNERSQHQNREVAMRVLKARLLELERQEQEKRLSELRGEQRSIEWGNQIRSYVFQPYTMVKDHRTGAETGNVPAVMDGEIDLFIQAYLRWSISEGG